MQKIKIRLPAALTNFGPSLGSLGIALGLYTHVEISPRSDEQLIVETSGEGAGYYAIGLRHPVVLAMIRIFQKLEKAPLGINIKIENHIPLASGLGAEAAFMAAGVIGANNLMGSIFKREEVLEMAAQISERPDSALTSILGGLTTSLYEDEVSLYRSLPLQPFRLIVAVPRIEKYRQPRRQERVPTQDAIHNLRRIPLLLEALKNGDVKLLASVIGDKLLHPAVTPNISGYGHVAEIARLAGAAAVTTSGEGPAMIVLTERNHERIVEAMETAFKNIDIPAQVWIVPIDTQGVVISMMQSS